MDVSAPARLQWLLIHFQFARSQGTSLFAVEDPRSYVQQVEYLIYGARVQLPVVSTSTQQEFILSRLPGQTVASAPAR